MRLTYHLFVLLCVGATMTSCVAKKKFLAVKKDLSNQKLELDAARKDLASCDDRVKSMLSQLGTCEKDKELLRNDDHHGEALGLHAIKGDYSALNQGIVQRGLNDYK